MSSLLRLASILSSGSSAREIIRAFGLELGQLIANESFGVLMYDAERNGFSWFHEPGWRSYSIEFIPDGMGLTSAVFHAGKAELINFATSDPRYWPPVESGTDSVTEHLMLAPLTIEQRRVGLLIVGRFGDKPFSQSEFELFQVVAELTAGALRGADTLQALRVERDTAMRSVSALEHLLDSHRVVSFAETYPELIRVVVSEVRALVPCRKLALIRLPGHAPDEVIWSPDETSIVRIEDIEPFIGHPAVQRALSRNEVQIDNEIDPSQPGFGGARSITEVEHLLVVPIHFGGRMLGAVVLTRIGEGRFDAIDAEVVRNLVMHAAVKSRNLSMLEESRESERREVRSRERVEAILATTRAIVSWHDLPQVIAAVADLLQHQIGHDRFLSISIDEEAMATVRHYRRGGHQVPCERRFALDPSPLKNRLIGGTMAVYNERLISQLAIEGPERGSRANSGGTLVYTIESPERIAGAVLLERTNGAHFNDEEQGTFEALCGLVAVAYQTASFFDEERRERTDADLLAEAGSTLSNAASLDELAVTIAGLVSRAARVRSSWCLVLDEAGTSIIAEASAGRPLPSKNGINATAAETIALAVAAVASNRDRVLTIDQLRNVVADSTMLEGIADDLRALPIESEGQIRGLVLIWDTSAAGQRLERANRLLAAVMDLARTALSRALIHREAERRIAMLNAISRLSQLAALTETRADEFCRMGATIAIDLTQASSVTVSLGATQESRTFVQAGTESVLDHSWIEQHWNTAQISRGPFEFDYPASNDRRPSTQFVLPIMADEGLLGLMVLSKIEGRFSQPDRVSATRIAEQMAVGLQRITTLELAIDQRSRADRQSATLGRVLEATSLFVTIHDREELLRAAVQSTAELLDCERIAIRWQDEDGETEGICNRTWPLDTAPDAEWERWFIEDAILTGTARRHADLGADPRLRFPASEASRITSAGVHLLVTPIGGDGSGIGAIAYTRIGGAPFDDDEFAALRIYAAQLTAALASARLIGRNRGLLVSGIRALVSAVDAKDPYTRGHSERVAQLSRMLATEMELTPQEIDTIELAGLLHDFGKIGVPDAILHKPGRLTAAERVIMMRHAGLGADMLAAAESEAMAALVPLVRHHHEWVNGGGYPDGLIGDQIPLGSAIISVADAYDTMTTDRPYRNRISHRQAMAELNHAMGRQFNASVVEALEKLASAGSLPRLYGPELDVPDVQARLPLAVEHQPTPIEEARALKLLLDMIPMTHLIADSDVFYQQVTDLVRRSLDLPQVSLFLTDDAGGGLVRIACSGDSCGIEPRQQPLAAGIRGAALRSRRFRVVADVRLDPAYDPAYDPAAGSMLLTPLIVEDTVIGLLSAEAADTKGIDPANQPVLQVVADQVASAVRLAQLHAEAQTAALTDPLTGLGNHRAFWNDLDDATGAGALFSVIMIDVEGLKRINDSLGHLEGDALLLRIAERVRDKRSAGDLAARLGGDEFAMVLRHRSAEQAVAVADEIRRSLLQDGPDQAHRATIRYGVASYPADGERPRDLVAVADSRLYAMMNQSAAGRSNK